jgi:NADPH-dependent 2,4-dienoyl-CoA reductase/sulfur reductase-like enzyme
MNCAEGIFLEYAAHIKAEVNVPVIAVGRLGDPELAMRVVDSGQADFVALGRPLIADPDWVAKAQSGAPVRRCLSCNGCVDGMRGGDQLRCVVNPAAARELEYAQAAPAASGERIAVIGAGPAGLSYAALAAGSNEVTVFEKAARTGGALRYAGFAPRFQNVEARQDALDKFIESLERSCTAKDVRFELGTEIADASELLNRGFDRVIVATGARYRHGLGPIVHHSLVHGWARSVVCRRFFDSPSLKDWLYYRGREPALPKLGKLSGDKVQVIGDAAAPGKTREAIESAFNAALRVPPRSPPS